MEPENKHSQHAVSVNTKEKEQIGKKAKKKTEKAENEGRFLTH